MHVEERLKELGYKLPNPPPVVANYITAVKVDNLLFTTALAPWEDGEVKYKGKIGKNLTKDEGYKAAQICALNCLSVIKSVIGDLEKIERVVRILGWINSAEDFCEQHLVLNGASDLLVAVLGEKGKHVRQAAGVSNPLDIAVELEMIVKIKD